MCGHTRSQLLTVAPPTDGARSSGGPYTPAPCLCCRLTRRPESLAIMAADGIHKYYGERCAGRPWLWVRACARQRRWWVVDAPDEAAPDEAAPDEAAPDEAAPSARRRGWSSCWRA